MKVTFLLITLAISAPFYECEHEGQMICQGKGFDTCDHGAFVYRECGKGTACKSQHGNVFCDYNQDYEHDDDEDYHRNSHDDHRNRPDEFDDDYKGHDHQRDDDDDHQRDEIHRVREDEKHKHQEDINEKPIHNIQFVATESSPGTICNLANYENNPKLQKCYSVCCSIGKGDCENCKTSKILALENSLSPVSVSSPLLTGGFTISGTVAAIVLMVTGLVFVFFGHKVYTTNSAL